jgi:hypothetical protein
VLNKNYCTNADKPGCRRRGNYLELVKEKLVVEKVTYTVLYYALSFFLLCNQEDIFERISVVCQYACKKKLLNEICDKQY